MESAALRHDSLFTGQTDLADQEKSGRQPLPAKANARNRDLSSRQTRLAELDGGDCVARVWSVRTEKMN